MSANPLRLTIVGAAGRMGKELIRATAATPDLRVTGAVASVRSPHLGKDIGEVTGGAPRGVSFTSDLKQALDGCDLVLEFTRASTTLETLATCRAARKPLFIGTSGMRAEWESEFDAAARDIPLIIAVNASLGSTVLYELVREAAGKLPKTFEVEIVEAHDNKKEDAPSGTALNLGRLVAQVRGQDFGKVAVLGSRAGKRPEGAIGYAVLRAGSIVDDHTVNFISTSGEHIALVHRATDYAVFVQGVLQATRWFGGQPKGRYAMRDVLGYK